MNTEDIIARVSTTIDAPKDKIWEALVTPKIIKQYFFGTDVKSDFRKGSAITWNGEWEGRPYQDKGEILDVQPGRSLQFSHISPASEKDIPENYRTVTIELKDRGGKTEVTLTQDNNHTEDAREHSEKNWQMMLDSLKKLLEKK